MAGVPKDWARSLVDPQAFQREQQGLAHVWTFLGLARDVARDGDWFRASIATRSVFVQRIGTELRGFENLCAHRFYPLRHQGKGNGPVICGFHGWQYDHEGVAVGIPLCKELFGKTPHEMDVRLGQIDLAMCGSLIFGRFPADTATQSLAEYLGDSFAILDAMTRMTGEPQYVARSTKSNWKLNLHITYDDYHVPAVHPTTLGRNGYAKASSYLYRRFGVHSIFLLANDKDRVQKLLARCRAGTYRSANYFILQILPNLVVSHARLYGQYWYCNIQQFTAVAPDRTSMRSWSFPAPFAANLSWIARTLRLLGDLLCQPVYLHLYKRVLREDLEICERLQGVAHQVDRAPTLGALEERVAWFEESLKELAGTAKEETRQ